MGMAIAARGGEEAGDGGQALAAPAQAERVRLITCRRAGTQRLPAPPVWEIGGVRATPASRCFCVGVASDMTLPPTPGTSKPEAVHVNLDKIRRTMTCKVRIKHDLTEP